MDLWLAEFDGPAPADEAPREVVGSDVAVAASAVVETAAEDGLSGLCRTWLPVEAGPWRRYRRAEASPGPNWQRLVPRISRLGASAPARAAWHYVVETDVEPGHEADFNAWYTQEHLPGLAAVPGTVHAARFEREGSPRYLALYLLTAPDVLGSPPWLAVRGTAWSDRVRPRFRHTRRLMFRAA